ncbi:MAG TPA: DUF1801 domain-containing protein [bacterium]|nr:DUF1801 domain-containing protein [bacterium]
MRTIDEFISSLPLEKQGVMKKIRQTIQKAAPEATEMMGYGVPAFQLKNGKKVYYSIFKNHAGFYPSPEAIEHFESELAGYKQAKGTIQFQLKESIPYDLIEKMVKYICEE